MSPAPLSVTKAAIPRIFNASAMMSPSGETPALSRASSTITSPAFAAAMARRCRFGARPEFAASRRSSRIGMARTVKARPTKRAFAGSIGFKPVKCRERRPCFVRPAITVGTETARKLSRMSVMRSPSRRIGRQHHASLVRRPQCRAAT